MEDELKFLQKNIKKKKTDACFTNYNILAIKDVEQKINDVSSSKNVRRELQLGQSAFSKST